MWNVSNKFIFPNIVDEDFIGATCLTTFTSASSAGTITVPTCLFAIGDDDLVELAETFSLSAAIINSNAQPAQFSSGGDSASVTINSDDGRLVEPNNVNCMNCRADPKFCRFVTTFLHGFCQYYRTHFSVS